jgi:hypothetical protein
VPSLADGGQRITNYTRFPELTDEWMDLVVEQAQKGDGSRSSESQ